MSRCKLKCSLVSGKTCDSCIETLSTLNSFYRSLLMRTKENKILNGLCCIEMCIIYKHAIKIEGSYCSFTFVLSEKRKNFVGASVNPCNCANYSVASCEEKFVTFAFKLYQTRSFPQEILFGHETLLVTNN